MHIKKYDHDFSRRAFLEKTAKGAFTAGVLAPLWPTIGNTGEITKAYPEELLSIEAHTKGKIKPGDTVDASNVDVVKHLLDPIAYKQIKEMGRKVEIVETTTDITKLFPPLYLEATLKNAGKAMFDDKGNVRVDGDKPWIGGNPFPEAKTGTEAFANITLSWGRHDTTKYAIHNWDISPSGDTSYHYEFMWAEQNTTGLVKDGPYWEGHEHMLRYQSVWFTAPHDSSGTSFLNEWHYDQNEFPELYGYLPEFKRVRRFPTNQRFEPLVPGVTFFLSDAWAAGDPMLTWGNYKIIGTQPMLGAVSQNYVGGTHENNFRPTHGGPKGETFFDQKMELCPECLVVECEPVKYPRSPVSKKRVYIDTRNQMFIAYITYDRRGALWKSFEPSFSQYVDPANGFTHLTDGKPTWLWTHFMSHDIQTNRMSRAVHAKEIKGGYKSEYNVGSLRETYMTKAALRRLGG